MKFEFFCIEDPLRKFFYNYAKFVSRHPAPFILLPVLFTGICAIGFLYEKNHTINDAVWLYTPTNGQAKREAKVLRQLFPESDGVFEPDRAVTDKGECNLIIFAKNGGNILNDTNISKAVFDLNDYVINRIKLFTNGTKYGWADLCLKTAEDKCYNNEIVQLIDGLWNNKDKYPGHLTYPTIRFGARSVYLPTTLGNVSTTPDGQIASALAWNLVYKLRTTPPSIYKLSLMWEKEFQTAMGNFKSNVINITYFHSQSLDDELVRTGKEVQPKFSLTFIILVGFAILCNTRFLPNPHCLTVDWVTSKQLLALSGVISAGMGVGAAIGFLDLCGYMYNNIVVVVPFLVVSVCVEYMFLMVGAFRRTNRCHPVAERLGESVSIHAVSILISLGTGALSFAVGAITTIPAVQIFCVYACVSMLFALVFQFTFFLGLLAVYAHVEEKRHHSLFYCPTIAYDKYDLCTMVEKLWLMGSRPNEAIEDARMNYSTQIMDRFFEDQYTVFIMKPWVKVATGLLLAVYLAFAIYGCTVVREGIEPSHLLVGDSYAVPHYEAWHKYFWHYGPQMQVVVSNAPDLSTEEGRNKSFVIAEAFANSRHGIGMKGVTFFLTDYLNFLHDPLQFSFPKGLLKQKDFFYTIFEPEFLSREGYKFWLQDIKWNDVNETSDQPRTIKSYRFIVGMRDFESSSELVDTVGLMREIATRFPENNVTTYNFFWNMADQYTHVWPNTRDNILIALLVMIVVSVVLIPHPICSLCVALAIVSIDVGVIGYMTLWGINVDAISMVTIIMSIGFSVDFTAHVSYGYVALSHETDPLKRMQVVLGARAWPITQAGLATILGILGLSLNLNAYVTTTFFKTVFLVMVSGIVHSLLFLPVMLDIFIRPVISYIGRYSD